MLKLTSLFLALVMLSTASFASTGVKEAVQDLNYALNVEWDQKDANFYSSQMNLFRERLQSLNLKGHSKKTLIAEALSAAPSSAFKANLEMNLAQVNLDQMSDSEIQNLLVKIANNSSAKGASWNGSAAMVMPALIVIGLLVLVVLAVNADKNSTAGEGTDAPYQCGYRDTCNSLSFGAGFDHSGMPIQGYNAFGSCYQHVCGNFYY